MIRAEYRAEWRKRGGHASPQIVPCECGAYNDGFGCPGFRVVMPDGRWLHWPPT